jgi:hypothetical protein
VHRETPITVEVDVTRDESAGGKQAAEAREIVLHARLNVDRLADVEVDRQAYAMDSALAQRPWAWSERWLS